MVYDTDNTILFDNRLHQIHFQQKNNEDSRTSNISKTNNDITQ